MWTLSNYLVHIVAGVLLLAQAGSCETAQNPLPNWLVGTIAVCAFLILAFAFLLVNYYFCDEFYEEPDDLDEISGYQNSALNVDDEMPEKPVHSGSPLKHDDEEDSHSVEKVGTSAVLDDVITTSL